MADGIALEIPGLDDMLRELRELPTAIRVKVLRNVVASGAAVIRREAVRLAPASTDAGPVKPQAGHPPPGTLKRAIYQTRMTQLCTPTDEVWKVDVRHGKQARSSKRGKSTANLDAYYAMWVEFGHFTRVPHSMTKTAKAAGRALGVARYVPAHPFMRPAFETQSAAALEAMRAKLADELPYATAAMKFIRATN